MYVNALKYFPIPFLSASLPQLIISREQNRLDGEN